MIGRTNVKSQESCMIHHNSPICSP